MNLLNIMLNINIMFRFIGNFYKNLSSVITTINLGKNNFLESKFYLKYE